MARFKVLLQRRRGPPLLDESSTSGDDEESVRESLERSLSLEPGETDDDASKENVVPRTPENGVSDSSDSDSLPELV